MPATWTFALIAFMTLVFFVQDALPMDELAFVPAESFDKPWMFISSIFLHANFAHLFFNMFALFIFGIYLESRAGSKYFLLAFFIGGIAGNVGYMLTAESIFIPGIGASGAVFGVIGTLAAVAPFAIVWIGFAPMPMIIAAVFYGVMEFLGLFTPSDIARGAHLGGLIIGVMYGLYLRSKLEYDDEPPKPRRIYRRYY